MNFEALKGMVSSLTNNFSCNECQSQVKEENVEIVGAAGNTINLDVTCPNCGKHSMIKSEVLSLDINGKMSKEEISKLAGKLNITKNNGIQIKDEEIVELNKDLNQDKLNVSDLFGEEK